MQGALTPEEIRALVRPLDEIDRKVTGGLVAVMIAEPSRIRDEEWLSEQFVRLAVVAHGFDRDADTATTEDVAAIQTYARSRRSDIFAIAIRLFVRTAEDLRARGGFTFDDARACVAAYLAPWPGR